jgi:hypothetical protein
VFGRAQRITGLSRRENAELVYELGYREAKTAVFKHMEGSLTAEWILSNPWFLKALFGNWSSSVLSGGVYTHSFSKSNSFSSSSMNIEVGFAGEVANVWRSLRGAILNSITLSGRVDDVVKVRGEILYAGEATLTSGQTVVVDTFAPMDFSQATLQLPTGSTLAEVQSFELSINNNALKIYGLGSSYAMAATPQAFEANGRLDITMKDRSLLDKLRGMHSGLVFTISNGLGSGYLNLISFTGTNVYFDEHSMDLEANSLVVEDLPIRILDVTALAQNTVATVP